MAKDRNPSLFGQILHWMLVPLLLLWMISMGIEYLLSLSIANAAYDRDLRVTLNSLARRVAVANSHVVLEPSVAGAASFHLEEEDNFLYQVRLGQGGAVYGHPALSAPTSDADTELQTAYFRNEVVEGKPMRVAYLFARPRGDNQLLLVQVAETLDKRIGLARGMMGGQLSIQFLIVPTALVLVWFGLAKGIEPLNELTARVRSRKPHDLSPLDPSDAPEEVRAFTYSINALMSRLEQSLRSQQRFVADAAHQLRTPIAGLKTQAELALRQRDLADIQHTVRQLAAGAERASRLTNQLLLLARADRDHAPRLEPLDLACLARDTTREWVPRAMERGIDLGFEGAEQACMVEGNELLLHELMNNLLDNAIRYTGSGGRVTTRLLRSDDIVVEIEDNGIGIDAPDRELVFERFYRVLGTGTDGTGLGLAIVRAIVDAHRGSVEIQENPKERGTLVRIRLPRTFLPARVGQGQRALQEYRRRAAA
jgi:two-component system sensor histidine kinase TctE